MYFDARIGNGRRSAFMSVAAIILRVSDMARSLAKATNVAQVRKRFTTRIGERKHKRH
jgi:hypothetical protein